MYLIFDTETTGIPQNWKAPLSDHENWPRVVQIAWQLHTPTGKLISQKTHIIKPEGFDIPYKAEQIHGISTQRAINEGEPLGEIINLFLEELSKATVIVGHNIEFDINIVGAELDRLSLPLDPILSINKVDTCMVSIDFCQLMGGRGGRFKMPKLQELHEKLFGEKFSDAHDASYDVAATARSLFGLIQHKVVPPIDGIELSKIIYEEPIFKSEVENKSLNQSSHSTKQSENKNVTQQEFAHLHVHSQYSILMSTCKVEDIIVRAKSLNMKSVAITDFGNLYGAFKFVQSAHEHKIKPIVGCEFYMSNEREKTKFTRDNPDRRFTQVFLSKNKIGYHNLCKLSSLGFIEGLYGIHPRIDKELVTKYKEGLMATTGSLDSEIPHLILNIGVRQAEEAFVWWHETFGDDFYVELNRHNLPEESHVNDVLIKFCDKYKVKYFAANELFYLTQPESEAHDVLLCIKNVEFKSTPIGKGRGKRIGLPNSEFYFKSESEMNELFADLPLAISNISEIVEKVESYKLDQQVVLPKFLIPNEFESEDEYLHYLTFQGAKKRYQVVNKELKDRLDFELGTIRKTGYPGYFLIVYDLISEAKKMGVAVGPGRGSVAGSAVAYCIGITNVEPIAYNLLFERFLNPDRVSLPDIDIDFDDVGRAKVLNYVIEKYGKNNVAQIITCQTMAAKSSIRDCARSMELPLQEVKAITSLVPNRIGTKLSTACVEIPQLASMLKEKSKRSDVLNQAMVVEGSLRSTGTHACGVIITRQDVTELIPVSTAKDSNMLVTQFDNSVIERAGLLKMDFLSLTTLNIISTTISTIKKIKDVDIDIENISLNDDKTFKLYQKGETIGTFQFESEGMINYLKALKPDRIEDLIAMNALYRPGPMDYIPNFIERKHGRELIRYDLPEMEEYLKDTYGITVYQEQVMLLSQKLANFSKGDADILRKAMGKKQKEVLDQMKDKFIEGCTSNEHDSRIANKIWKDWEAFAEYAFNKSHSTSYSLLAYQTAYLKANFPAEYMVAVLTHSQGDIDKVASLIEESRRMGINVLGPSINESGVNFQVNKDGDIRFGIGAVKGAGSATLEFIIQERDENGDFKDIFDFASRIHQKVVNKNIFQCLALAGAFDSFTPYHRKQYVYNQDGYASITELAMRYASRAKLESMKSQINLFGAVSGTEAPNPTVKDIEPFSNFDKLAFEKEVLGVYISGHPLDNYKFEIDEFVTSRIKDLTEGDNLEGKEFKICGIVLTAENGLTRTGSNFGKLMLADYSGKIEFILWKEEYVKFKSYFTPGWFLFVEGKVIRRKWGEKKLEFKINNIELLDEIGVRKAKGLILKTDISVLTLDSVDKLEAIFNEYKGTTPLYINFQDNKSKVHLEMQSRKYLVKPVNDLVSKLRQISGVKLKLLV